MPLEFLFPFFSRLAPCRFTPDCFTMKSREGSRVKHWVRYRFTLLAQLLLILVGFWVGIQVRTLPPIGIGILGDDVILFGPDATSLFLVMPHHSILLGTSPTACLPAWIQNCSSLPSIRTDYQFQFPSIRIDSPLHSIWTVYSFHSFWTGAQLLPLSIRVVGILPWTLPLTISRSPGPIL